MTLIAPETRFIPTPNLRPLGLERFVWIAAAMVLSLLFTGYIPYFNNNIYHLPILRADYDLPQFAGDAFVQSLRHFSSGFWMLAAGSAAWIPPRLFLFAAFLISRALMMAAALGLAERFGYGGRRFTGLFLLLVAISPLARGYAPGGGGLNIEYFSHSELANATLLFSLSAAMAGKFGRSVFLACLTFFLNAFMAVWLAPLWLAIVFEMTRRGDAPLLKILRSATIGGLAGLPLVLPVVHAVLGSGDVGKAADYSYAAFLRGFFPFHFFMDALPRSEHVQLCLFAVVMLFLYRALPRNGRLFLAASLASIALLAIGSILPLLSENRFLLNLHLIRSAVLLQIFTVLGLAMAAAGWISQPKDRHESTLGFLMAALLVIGHAALAGMAGILAYRAIFEQRVRLTALDSALMQKGCIAFLTLVTGLAVPTQLFPRLNDMSNLSAVTAQWERAGDWMRVNTPATSTILLPVRVEKLPTGANPRSVYLDYEISGFVATSGRSIWTHYKFGAAAMWSPGNFKEWRKRYDEVLALDTIQERIAYASTNHITFLATFCDLVVAKAPVYRDGDLCIYQTAPLAP